jgi:Skp family chaperone for outer membrane proteins
VKRVYVGLMGAAALGIAGWSATVTNAQAPAGGAAPAAAAPASRGTAVFNVARVMKEYTKWQFFAASMNNTRAAKAGELQGIRARMMDIEKKLSTESVAANKTPLEQQLVALQRQFEDMERQVRKEIDEASANHLKQLFAEIRTVVDAVAKTNGFELVLAYPDAITQEEMNSPLYFDLKMRPPAAMPFYVSPSIDITKVVVDTLNKNFPAPGPVPAVSPGVAQTGGAAPNK